MSGIINNVIKLKKFFGLVGRHREIPVANLLSTNESLKNFGRAWNGNAGGDVLMMLAVVEHEYMAENSYNEEEMNAVKFALSRVAKFMKNAGSEWSDYEAKQVRKAKNLD